MVILFGTLLYRDQNRILFYRRKYSIFEIQSGFSARKSLVAPLICHKNTVDQTAVAYDVDGVVDRLVLGKIPSVAPVVRLLIFIFTMTDIDIGRIVGGLNGQ